MKRENRKTHCFIDYENVHESGFEGVEALSDGDSVTIFISSVSHKISLVVLETLLRKKCELNIIHTIGTGKNNLDFQLIAEVGYQIGRHNFEAHTIQFAIISKDRGYENVVTAFLNRGFHILQCETIQKIVQNEEEAPFEPMADGPEPEWEFAGTIQKCLVSLKMSTSDLKRIDAIFRDSHSLNVLHDRLVKAFGKKGNHPIYGKLKSLHKQYQKTLPAIDPDIFEAQSERVDSTLPELAQISEMRAADMPLSLEVFWDQLLEESGPLPAEDIPAAETLDSDSAAPRTQPDKPVTEIKKKTRGRKRKQPATKTKAETEGMTAVQGDSAAAHEALNETQSKPEPQPKSEPQTKLEAEALIAANSAEAPAELPEKQVEKKKRRPGRPRKKNGTAKSAEFQSVNENAEATKPKAADASEPE